MPTAPKRQEPPQTWQHRALYERVRKALYAVPSYFKTETVLSGITAVNLFTLGDFLGSAVEEQVAQTLNEMRMVWDPEGKYKLYSFVRQGQTFPDVLLQSRENGRDIILGVELKNWYLLAKEAVPNFRFVVNESVCNPWDLLAVVPWALSSVLSGRPVVFSPWVDSAKYVAQYRNYWWRTLRKAKGSIEIVEAEHKRPYPNKADKISDQAAQDGGGNFGRIARTGIMDDYVSESLSIQLCGIDARSWIEFFHSALKPAAH